MFVVLALAAAGCGSDSDGDGDAATVDARAAVDASLTDAARVDAVGLDAAPTCGPTPCPVDPNGYALGDPMIAVDGCAFPMQDADIWDGQNALVGQLAAELTAAPIADVLDDLNRTGVVVASTALSSGTDVSNVAWAFAWNSGDNNVAYWIPQGLTGSPDATATGLVDGKRLALTTWYYDAASDPSSPGDKGVRISLADITNPADVSYRLLLLVEPYDDDGRANFREIPIHAGGVVWFGDYLYVADTGNGFRVFDMTRILQVATGTDVMGYDDTDQTYYAHNYKYVVPQVGRYQHASDCGPRYSFVALDRSSTPPSLISGEYNNASVARRVFRWPLDPATGRLPTGLFHASEALHMGYSHVQGAVAHDGRYYLSTSEPPSGRGDLVATDTVGPVTVGPWVDGPEDLVYDIATDELWGCGEAVGKRYVFAVDPPP
jgi:hypothetical protein